MSLESLAGGINEMKSTQGDSGNAMKFDPDKRMDVNDNRTLFADNNAPQFDPDKRMDANDNRISDFDNETKFDPDKRVDFQEKDHVDIDNEQKHSVEKNTESEKDIIPEKIKCINEALAGKTHSETGVPFERKLVQVDEKLYEVVVPKFDSAFDAQLPADKLKETDVKQFKECNTQLKDAIANNKELREKFDDEQLEQIENGDTPDGYTWHHDAEVGKMQLVDTETHQKTGHTGGRAIWGGGTENR